MKLPFTFGIQIASRLLLPGLIVGISAYPLLSHYASYFPEGFTPTIGVTITTALSGWLFILADMHIYMLLEGRRYWPRWLSQWARRRQQSHVDDMWEKRKMWSRIHRDAADGSAERREARARRAEISVTLRWYPSEEGRPLAEMPTRFGNLLRSYEKYSEDIYGMQSMFYWPRLWLLMSDDERKEIDSQQSMVDGATYSIVALFLSIGLFLIAGFAVAGLYYIFSTLALLAAFLLYKLSLYAHAQFGQLYKSVFDVHHTKFPTKDIIDLIKQELSDVPDGGTVELGKLRERNMNVYRWCHNRRLKFGDEVRSISQRSSNSNSSSQTRTS